MLWTYFFPLGFDEREWTQPAAISSRLTLLAHSKPAWASVEVKLDWRAMERATMRSLVCWRQVGWERVTIKRLTALRSSSLAFSNWATPVRASAKIGRHSLFRTSSTPRRR